MLANMLAMRREPIRNVGIKELKDQASTIVNTGEAVIIERYGRPVGLYVPLGSQDAGDKACAYQLAENINRLMTQIAAQNGLTPEALADELAQITTDPDRQAS